MSNPQFPTQNPSGSAERNNLTEQSASPAFQATQGTPTGQSPWTQSQQTQWNPPTQQFPGAQTSPTNFGAPNQQWSQTTGSGPLTGQTQPFTPGQPMSGGQPYPNWQNSQGFATQAPQSPWYKVWWIWVLIAVFVIAALGITGFGLFGTTDNSRVSNPTPTITHKTLPTKEPTTDPDDSDYADPTQTAIPGSADSIKNAKRSAKDYVEYLDMSREATISQLEYEGFTQEDAIAAIDSLNINWNEEAASTIKSSLEFRDMNRGEAIEFLIILGFTQEEAEYGATYAGL